MSCVDVEKNCMEQATMEEDSEGASVDKEGRETLRWDTPTCTLRDHTQPSSGSPQQVIDSLALHNYTGCESPPQTDHYDDIAMSLHTEVTDATTKLTPEELCQLSAVASKQSVPLLTQDSSSSSSRKLVVIEENTDQNIVLVPSTTYPSHSFSLDRETLGPAFVVSAGKDSYSSSLLAVSQGTSSQTSVSSNSAAMEVSHLAVSSLLKGRSSPSISLTSGLSVSQSSHASSHQVQTSAIFSVPMHEEPQQASLPGISRAVLPPASGEESPTEVRLQSTVTASTAAEPSILDRAVAQSLLPTSLSPGPAVQLTPTSMGSGSHQMAFLKFPLGSNGHDGPGLDAPLECRWLSCNQLYHHMDDLVNHVNVAHVKVERDVEYKCRWEGCPRNGRGFNARYKMLIHVRTHTNEKPHRCGQCGKSFSRLENLKIHNRSHTGERPYVCPFEGCTKAYSNSSDRFKHVRTHQVDKPYCCKMPGCNKRYTDPSSLRKHIKTRAHFFRGQPLLIRPNGEPNTMKTEQGNDLYKLRDQSHQHQQQSLSPIRLNSPISNVLAIAPNGLLSPSQVISLHGNIVPISSLASNPLLSSTMNITPLVNTQSTSTQTETVVTVTGIAPPGESLKDLRGDSPIIDSDGKIQDGPLDLSTSPVHMTNSSVDMVSTEGVCLNGVLPPKWDLMNSDVYR